VFRSLTGTTADDKDKVIIQTSTVTDPNGYFAIFVSPLEHGDEYNLVIYADGKVPEYKKNTGFLAGETLTLPEIDIQLEVASNKNVN
jgi:hypothetical protein